MSAFAMTREEKVLLGTVLAIALLGLVARYSYLHGQRPSAYQPGKLPHEIKRSHSGPVEE